MEIPPDWNEFISLLLRHRVKFLLIGAHALAAHAQPRATLDLDVFVEPSRANATRIGSALKEFGFPQSAAEAQHLAVPDRMMRLGREPLRIDILNEISGVRFATAWRNRVRGPFGKNRVNIIGRADLRRNKVASGRPKDVADVAMLDADKPRTSRPRRTRATVRR